jgi:hypothetical protein
MVQQIASDDVSEEPYTAEISDGKLVLQHPPVDPREPPVTYTGDIETRRVNKYTMFETEHSSFQSSKASKEEHDGAFAVWIDQDTGELVKHVKLHSPHSVPPTADSVDISHNHGNGSDWDVEIEGAIHQKTTQSWGKAPGRSQRTGSTKRIKIERAAVEQAARTGQDLYVMTFESSSGGSTGSRGNSGTSFNTHSGKTAYKLEVNHD